ncbi:MAG: amidohydrolase [Gemmatimonadetes bacterium]|nr:amidohydrolase [Gemmatimonadota bacterium]MYH19406.1 amidohydrolase [Gemmatimonadota bacterium]MYK97541.1 amidohydrolase [Gemmatimonadota bacterium]
MPRRLTWVLLILGMLIITNMSREAVAQQYDAGAQQDNVAALVAKHRTEAIRMREHIHRNPELSNREFKTAALVADHLTALGIEIQTGVAHTGVVGVLKGGRPGPVVAIRADMDALPVTEETVLPFRSTVRTTYLGQEVGVMHACGHDVHTAVQMGVASVLAEMKDDLPGTVKFIFQPAEEGAPPGEEGGADLMVRENVLEDPTPEAIFGLHALPSLDVGTVGYTIGPAFAAVDHFTIKVQGKQAHGARPEEGIDPVVMASEIVMALQTIRSRTLSPLEPSVVTVGIFRGGERFNIIPRGVHLEGTVRTYNPEVRDTVERRMTTILEGITGAYGGSFILDYDRGTPSVINDPVLSRELAGYLTGAPGVEQVLELPPTMGGEDFAYFANEIPGFFYRLGTTRPGQPSGGLHTPTMTADSESVGVGMRVMAHLVLEFLNARAPRSDQ